jgi:uracil-DNA glycosylase
LGRPFAWTAGKTLFQWFSTLGVEEAVFRQRVYMSAVIRCFPGKIPGKTGDRKPSPSEIETCAVHRETELTLLRPALVIPVGRMAIELFVECPSLDAVIGKRYRAKQLLAEHRGRGFDVIPLPHPSGLSRWIQTRQGKAKIKRALKLIGAHDAWREAFGPGAASPKGRALPLPSSARPG